MLIKAKNNPTQRNSDSEIMAIGVPYEEDDKAAESLISIDAAELATDQDVAKMQPSEGVQVEAIAPQVTTKETVVTPAATSQKVAPVKVTGES